MTAAINKWYVKKGHSVDLVTMHYGQLPHCEVIDGVKIFRVRAIRKKQVTCTTFEMLSFVLSAIPFALKLTKDNKYDIVHCHFVIPTGILAYVLRKFRGLEYILTAHGSDIPGHNPDRFQFEHRFTGPLLRMIMVKAKVVVTMSRSLKNTMARNITAGVPITVIPNGVDPDMFSGLLKRKNWILMAGKYLPFKGFQYALQALRDHPLPGWEIHLIGDGPYKEELEALAQQLSNKVVFHGWLLRGSAEFMKLYEQSRIFIFPSDTENAPMALLEAMNAGLAIIALDIPSCGEVLKDTAILVPPHDAPAIAAAISQLIQNINLMSDYSQKARQRSLERFSWGLIVDKYLKLMEGV